MIDSPLSSVPFPLSRFYYRLVDHTLPDRVAQFLVENDVLGHEVLLDAPGRKG
jgi:hypothetical protein